MKHDYAQALENFNRGSFDYEDRDTILHALRFAEKMMGEPSFPMYQAGFEEIALGQSATEVFESMRDAALKELGE